jgi:hypothetical protein
VAVTEESRHRLYERLEEVLGPEQAATLMEHLPPVGWADVATRRDLDQLEERLTLRMDLLGTELRSELGNEITGLRAEIHQELGAVRAEIGGLRAEFHSELRKQAFTMIVAMFGAMSTLSGLAFAAGRLV